ncbi:hypothetical protein BEP19_13810 [Ammoniphilus oxalaticus]|uniref:DUF2249 domain-containing protein n=1 Tax=Ammoniphilus oxalaticus TaxID=66863 RepID=A0A419SEG8_9BACL|nr:DUF2249 domain-containing protein [Ammoniphilus oxalaticus]RKD21703.1 hypothetical protein BEP19_13810 [Ammoniphilus oxalaticus]
MSEPKTIELDVREDLKNKLDPYQKIMDAIRSFESGDIFILHVSLKPLPLFTVMKAKGFTHKAVQLDNKYWKVTFTKN